MRAGVGRIKIDKKIEADTMPPKQNQTSQILTIQDVANLLRVQAYNNYKVGEMYLELKRPSAVTYFNLGAKYYYKYSKEEGFTSLKEIPTLRTNPPDKE